MEPARAARTRTVTVPSPSPTSSRFCPPSVSRDRSMAVGAVSSEESVMLKAADVNLYEVEPMVWSSPWMTTDSALSATLSSLRVKVKSAVPEVAAAAISIANP